MEIVSPSLSGWLEDRRRLPADSKGAERSALVLDRDGVINKQNYYYISSQERFSYEEGSLEALRTLYGLDLDLYVATNQSGIAKKVFSAATVDALHDRIQQDLASSAKHHAAQIELFTVCPHQALDDCNCRKPQTGLLKRIDSHRRAHQCHSGLQASPFIGDSFRDLLAAVRYSLLPVLVLTGNGRRTYQQLAYDRHVQAREIFSQLSVFSSLAHVARYFHLHLKPELAPSIA